MAGSGDQPVGTGSKLVCREPGEKKVVRASGKKETVEALSKDATFPSSPFLRRCR